MEKKKFYLNDNLTWLINNEHFVLIEINFKNNDFGTYLNYVFGYDADTVLNVPYNKLCYNDLANNEYFLKTINDLKNKQ